MAKKSNQEPSLKSDLRKLIKIEGELLEEPKDLKFTFSLVFSYPKGKDEKTGKPLNPIFQVNKGKQSKFAIISSRIGFTTKDFDNLKLKDYILNTIKKTIQVFNLEPKMAVEFEENNNLSAFYDSICAYIRGLRINVVDLTAPLKQRGDDDFLYEDNSYV